MSRYTIACYYFPNYHPDPRNAYVHGAGWTEWELVRLARPRFPGHLQPKVPTWGFEDESNPDVMALKIAAASEHAIDAFIFDWYWYDDGPFLERALDQGFLGAPNNDRLKFALMWANHDWLNIHPARLRDPATVLYPGAVTRETFGVIAERVVERYFRHPSYLLIEGCPYFSIYDLAKLVEGFGSIQRARAALDAFRSRARREGFPDLHLNAVIWSIPTLPGERGLIDPNQTLRALGFDSITSYVWVHHVPLDQFPEMPYLSVMDRAVAHWRHTAQSFRLPYHPNVTVGWDPSPRTVQSDRYMPVGYPFTSALSGNTPGAFRAALLESRQFLDSQPEQSRILTINAWNEWTEGSYLEPDSVHGLAYLEAINDVFGEFQTRRKA